jgi:hypothetical protein
VLFHADLGFLFILYNLITSDFHYSHNLLYRLFTRRYERVAQNNRQIQLDIKYILIKIHNRIVGVLIDAAAAIGFLKKRSRRRSARKRTKTPDNFLCHGRR